MKILYQGDSLIKILAKILCAVFGGGPSDDDVINLIFGKIFGEGSVLPGIIVQTAPVLLRLAFPFSENSDTGEPIDNIGSRKGSLLYDKISGEFHPEYGFEANDNDPNWKKRGIVPLILLPLVRAFRLSAGPPVTKEEYFSRGDFSTTSSIKATLKGFLEYIIPVVGRPILYYQEGNDGSKEGEKQYPLKAWLPRLIDDNKWFMRTCDVPGIPYDESGNIIYDSWEERCYYQPYKLRTFLDVLIDSDPFNDDNPQRMDGILSLLTEYDVDREIGPDNPPNTRIITQIYKMVLAGTNPKFDELPEGMDYDENDYTTWSTNEKLSYGMEQIIATIKGAKGEYVKNYSGTPKGWNYADILMQPDWIFTEKGIRPEDINFDKIIEEFIGSDESGKGLAVVPDTRPNPEDWDNFNKLVDALGELLSDNGETGGKYNIMEELISLIDILNTKVDASDIHLRGFRHTIGSIFTKYNKSHGEWEYPDDLSHIITDELPEILEVFQGHYNDLLVLVDSLAKEDGFLEYLIYTFDSAYTGRDIFEQLHAFLGTDIIARHDSKFWNEFAELLVDFSELIGDAGPGWLNDDTFQANSRREVIDSAEPYEGLGELLSW